LPQRHAPPQLIEKIKQESHLRRACLSRACGGGSTAKRLPSGANAKFSVVPAARICRSDQTRGLQDEKAPRASL